MKEKTWFDRWVDFEYERLNNLITTEIRQKLEIIEELGLENEIDKYLIEDGLVDQEWFRRYKLEPYLSQKFPYHIRSVNHANLRLRQRKRRCQCIFSKNIYNSNR